MFFDWKRDDNSKVPVYVQLYEYFRLQIESGVMEAGHVFPSISELCSLSSLGKNTVIRALNLLADDGYISTSPKKRATVKWRKILPSSPDWYRYFSKSKHVQTDNIYRAANIIRSKSNVINLFDTRIGRDFDPSRLIQKAISNVAKRTKDIHHQSYFDIKGIPWVREAVCSYLRKYNIYADSSQVLMGQGPINSVTTVTHGLMAPGMNIYVPVPNTITADKAFFTAGLNTVEIAQDNEGIDINAFRERIRGRDGLLYVHTAASWPSTITMREPRLKEVLSICSHNKIPVLECDMMREWHVRSEAALPMKAHDVTDNVIYIFSFTRPLMPGLRISAIVGPEMVINRLAEIRLQSDWVQDNLSQLVMGELLSNGIFDDYMAETRPLLFNRLEEADKLMHTYLDGIARWVKSDYGLNFWVEFDKRLDVSELNTEKDNVLIYPGKLGGKDFKNYMWICYAGVSLPEFERALSVISNRAYDKLKSLPRD